eukprot:366519-Chlamydomonas_euryale.AAC.26
MPEEEPTEAAADACAAAAALAPAAWRLTSGTARASHCPSALCSGVDETHPIVPGACCCRCCCRCCCCYCCCCGGWVFHVSTVFWTPGPTRRCALAEGDVPELGRAQGPGCLRCAGVKHWEEAEATGGSNILCCCCCCCRCCCCCCYSRPPPSLIPSALVGAETVAGSVLYVLFRRPLVARRRIWGWGGGKASDLRAVRMADGQVGGRRPCRLRPACLLRRAVGRADVAASARDWFAPRCRDGDRLAATRPPREVGGEGLTRTMCGLSEQEREKRRYRTPPPRDGSWAAGGAGDPLAGNLRPSQPSFSASHPAEAAITFLGETRQSEGIRETDRDLTKASTGQIERRLGNEFWAGPSPAMPA